MITFQMCESSRDPYQKINEDFSWNVFSWTVITFAHKRKMILAEILNAFNLNTFLTHKIITVIIDNIRVVIRENNNMLDFKYYVKYENNW